MPEVGLFYLVGGAIVKTKINDKTLRFSGFQREMHDR